ncbi:MAG: MarR family transcriptional regulator, partial [Propionibacteriaceae bacterium]|nr:MarR family transcriptional regulator [Propionibacteriaceae bacterium]
MSDTTTVPTPELPPDEPPATEVRQLAADRLAYLGGLQSQRRLRAAADRAPWHDPRQGQGRVLALLKLKPEMTQRELTFLTGLTRQSLAELLNKLEAQGLLTREPSTADRRRALWDFLHEHAGPEFAFRGPGGP